MANGDGLGRYSGFREVVHSGRVLIGAILTIPDPAVARILGISGIDFVVADAEHGPFTLSTLRTCIEALAATPAASVVRLGSSDPGVITQMLELGVDGVQVPHVGSAEEARALIDACRYPPEGHRGIGIARPSNYGADLGEYVQSANSAVVAFVMIEDAEGVKNVDDIASVEGIDGLMIGSQDLAGDLGVPGQPGHPLVAEAEQRIIDSGAKHDLPVGVVCATEAQVAPAVQRGAKALMILVDVFLLSRGAKAGVDAFRASYGEGRV